MLCQKHKICDTMHTRLHEWILGDSNDDSNHVNRRHYSYFFSSFILCTSPVRISNSILMKNVLFLLHQEFIQYKFSKNKKFPLPTHNFHLFLSVLKAKCYDDL